MVVLEKTLESPLDWKEIQPVHPKDQSWVFIGRTDIEAETPILWPPDAKSWLIWKDPDAGKDWGQGEKGTTEDEMVGWHHQLNGHEFEWTLRVGDGQGGLMCCGSWGHKESDTTERLNWTELKAQQVSFQVRYSGGDLSTLHMGPRSNVKSEFWEHVPGHFQLRGEERLMPPYNSVKKRPSRGGLLTRICWVFITTEGLPKPSFCLCTQNFVPE